MKFLEKQIKTLHTAEMSPPWFWTNMLQSSLRFFASTSVLLLHYSTTRLGLPA